MTDTRTTAFNDDAQMIWGRQYALTPGETPEQGLRRVADHVALAEHRDAKSSTGLLAGQWADRFYDLMMDKKFCPGGRILAGAGTVHGQLLNCFQGDTIVETRDGQKAIRDLSGDVEILSQDGVYRTATFRSFGQQELLRVTFANGETVEATPGHQWVHGKKSSMKRGGKYPRVPTTDLVGKFVPIIATKRRPARDQDFITGLQHGIVYGDGHRNTDSATHEVRLFGEKRQLARYFDGSRVADVVYDERPLTRISGLRGELKDLPDAFASDSHWYGFFVGLMATDGNVDDRGSSALYSSEVAELEALGQQLHRFGIKHASVKQMTETTGRYGPRPCYVLRLLKQTMLPEDFIRDDQRANFEKSLVGKPKNASLEVISVEPTGRTEEVFCCTEMETHTMVIHGGYLTGQCFVQGATDHNPASFDGIMEVAKKLALVTKVGGGNGVNLDVYAPQTVFTNRHFTGIAYLRADHPDAETFVRGLMAPSNQPDGKKVPTPLKNFEKRLYGPTITPELRELAQSMGIEYVKAEGRDELYGDGLPLVIPDDLGGIIDAAAQVAGQGLRAHIIDLSEMRPEGTPIKGSGGTSSGPFSFLVEIFDNFLEWANRGAEASGPVNTLRYVYAPVLRVVRQGGTRRGAGMATISIDNPHILDFITCKDLDREALEGDISTFNISILVTERFWQALERGGDTYFSLPEHLVFPEGKYERAALSDRIYSEAQQGAFIYPQWLWDQIAEHAWSTGEPGLIFVDRVNEFSALKNLGEKYQIRSTNPLILAA